MTGDYGSAPDWRKNLKSLHPRKFAFTGSAYRPESVVSRAKKNSNLLNQVKYKPIGARSAGARRRKFPAAGPKGKKQPNFSFSIPLLPVICILVLGTVFVIDNRDVISSMMYRDVIPSPHADSGGEASMASYAGGTGVIARQVPLQNVTPDINANAADVSGSDKTAANSSAANSFTANEFAKAPGVSEAPGNVVSVTLKEEPIPLKMVEYFAWESYTVKKGDSVSSIASSHGLSMDAIIASNDLTNAHLLKIGQVLRVPNMNGIPYVVKKGDTLSKISQTYNIPLEVLVDVNNIQRDLIIPGQNVFLPGARMPARELSLAIGTLFVNPLKGTGYKMSSPFGWREDPFGGGQRLHEALDLAISTGTPIKAASSGKISMVGLSPVYGKYIIINHGDNYQTLYAHLSEYSVKQGDTVAQGAKIGEVGSTGLSTGPHLHFALYKNGRAVNPLEFFTM